MRHSQKIRERIIRGDTVHLDVPEFAGEDNDLDQRQIFLPKDDLILRKTKFSKSKCGAQRPKLRPTRENKIL